MKIMNISVLQWHNEKRAWIPSSKKITSIPGGSFWSKKIYPIIIENSDRSITIGYSSGFTLIKGNLKEAYLIANDIKVEENTKIVVSDQPLIVNLPSSETGVIP